MYCHVLGCDAKRFKGDFKCPYHVNGALPTSQKTKQDDQHKELPYAYQSIPDILKLSRTSTVNGETIGVQTVKPLPAGAWIGPYEGKMVKLDDNAPMKKNDYMWEVNKTESR
jgi:hypothetical protein